MIRKGTLKQSKSKYSKLFIREEYFKFIKGRYFCMKNLLEHFNINVANNGIYYREFANVMDKYYKEKSYKFLI